MLLIPWLQNLRNRLQRRAPRFRRRKQFSPVITIAAQVQQLEDRKLLSGVVTTTADSGTGSLRQAILDADANTGPQTITFAIPGGPATIDLVSALPDLTGTITIQGPGADDVTVERSSAAGTPQLRIFQVDSGATADISGLTIANGDSNFLGGGGVYNDGTLTIESSTLSNNSTPYFGGGIYNDGTLTVTGSTLSGNSETSRYGQGSGIFNVSGCTLTVTSTTFSSNSASLNGGGIENNGVATVTNSTLSGNSAGNSGGAMCNYGTLNVYGSIFTGDTTVYDGGAIVNANGTVNVSGGAFSNNCAGRNGGCIDNSNGTVTVTNNSFSGNSATAGGGIANEGGGNLTVTGSTLANNSATFGGGIVSTGGSSTLTINDSTLSGNTATERGGGIWAGYGMSTVTGSTLSGNSAIYGGGIFSAYGNLTATSTTLSGNTASRSGGGIMSNQATLTVTDVTVDDNSAAGGNGGGILSVGTATVANSTLSGNSAGSSGGGMYSGGTLNVTGSTFAGNTARYDGGGIGSSGTLYVSDDTISNNSGGRVGGGISNRRGTLTVANSTLSGNSAGDGGGIWSSGAATVTNIMCSGNTASYRGGGIDSDTSPLTVTNSTFSDNSANRGAGIASLGMSSVTGSAFSGNSAPSGGGIWNAYGTMTVTNTTLSGNSAARGGGGILNEATLTITDSTLDDNSTAGNGGGGGGILNHGNMTVKDCALTGNSSSYEAGGVGNSGTLTITGSTLSDNIADVFGGGINNDGTLTVTDTMLSGNSGGFSGGGIFNRGTLSVTGATLSSNSADYGGGIYSQNGGTLTVTGSTLSNNSAHEGGGIDSRGMATVTNSTLSGNTAVYDGGALWTGYSAVAVTNTTISGNSAGRNGGGVYGRNDTLTVADSMVDDNSAGRSGGGIVSNVSTLTITDSMVDDNSAAGGNGGGIDSAGITTVTNSTLSGNSAAGNGGGIFSTYSSTLILSSTTLSGNSAASGGGIFNVGQLSFGFPPGQVAVSGDYFQTGNGQLAIELGGTTPGTQYDQLDVAANVSLAGALNVSFTNGFTSTAGETFTIIKNDGGNPVSSTFAGLAQGAFITVGGRQFQISYIGGDGNDVTLTDDPYVVTNTNDSGPGSLREAITEADANPGNTIIFAIPGGPATIDLASALPDLTGTIAIQGPGAANVTVERSSVSGTPQFDIFTVDGGATADISGLTIAHGDTSFLGGGIVNNGTLSIESSTLSNNSTVYFGGGIYNVGTLTVTGSTLSGNSASYGGGIDNNGTLTVADSTISGNSATYGGGIWTNDGSLTVTGTTLSGNSAAVHGGGIVDRLGTLTVTDCTVDGNSATTGLGGGILNYGGAITVTSSTFSGNSAVSGGGIDNYVDSTLTVTDTALSDNSASQLGGGIDNVGTLTINGNSSLSGNTAIQGGCIFNEGGGTLTVADSTLSGNSATNGGGIINVGSLTVTGDALSANTAYDGAGIFNIGALSVSHSAFSGNAASHQGGGLFNVDTSPVTITDSTFSGNSAAIGGGIDSTGPLAVSNSTISWNSATQSGGAITVTSSTFSSNSAAIGGGIDNYVSSTLTVSDSTLLNNTAGFGGGIYNQSGGTLILGSTTLSGNSAVSGSGIDNDGQLGFGFPPGLVAASGNYLQTANGQLSIQLGGTTPGTQYDQVDVAANVSLAGALNVSFTNGFTSTAGQTFTIIKNDGSNPVSGTFANLPEGALLTVGGRQFQISYTGGSSHHDVILTCTTDVLTDTTPAATLNAVEGNSTGSVVLATFVDSNPAAPSSDFSTSVNWGGTLVGTPSTIVQLVSRSATVSTWQVVGSATYAEEGNYTATVTVNDADGAGVQTSNTTVSVAAAPSILKDTTKATTDQAIEGNSTGSIVLATFTDSNRTADAADYNVAVNWGGTVIGSPAVSVLPVGNSSAGSTWQVVGNVIYAETGKYAVAVSVSAAGGGNRTDSKTKVDVDEAPLADTGTTTSYNALEGNSTGTVVLATFTDGNPYASVSDFTANVDWDGTVAGSASQSIQLVSRERGVSTWQVLGSAAYAHPGQYTPTVTVKDSGVQKLKMTDATLAITEAPLTDSTPPFTTLNAVEGNSTGTVVLATFTDANPYAAACDFILCVDWGGTLHGDHDVSVQFVSSSLTGGSQWEVVGSATYLATGNHTVTVKVSDRAMGLTTNNTTINVAAAPLSDTTPLRTVNAIEGNSTGNVVLATFTDANPYAAATDFAANVNWGGTLVGTAIVTVQPVSHGDQCQSQQWQVVGSAVYATPGSYNVTVMVTSAGGSTFQTANTSFCIADASLTDDSRKASVNATRGTNTGNVVLAAFAYGDPNATAADFMINVNWGGVTSGTPNVSLVLVSQSKTQSLWEVLGSATYAADGTFTAAIAISDLWGASILSKDSKFHVTG